MRNIKAVSNASRNPALKRAGFDVSRFYKQKRTRKKRKAFRNYRWARSHKN